jgi:hypothetical protein
VDVDILRIGYVTSELVLSTGQEKGRVNEQGRGVDTQTLTPQKVPIGRQKKADLRHYRNILSQYNEVWMNGRGGKEREDWGRQGPGKRERVWRRC